MARHFKADGIPLFVTHHAVERYIERCSPELRLGQARKELAKRCRAAIRVTQRPWWIGYRHRGPRSRYFLLDDDTVAVAFKEPRGFIVHTVLTRHQGHWLEPEWKRHLAS